MGAFKLIIEVDMADPAAVSIGGHLAGGRVTAIRLVEKSLVSAAQVAQQYGVSVETARDVPLSTEARRLLSLLDPQATGPVVPLSKNAFRLSSQRLWRKAGADFTFHDTRHEAISRMVRTRRLPVEILMKITGHKTASVLINTYYNPTVDELAEMLQ